MSGSRESGSRGVGSRESGVGSRESGVGSRESGVGSRESGVGQENHNPSQSPTLSSPLSYTQKAPEVRGVGGESRPGFTPPGLPDSLLPVFEGLRNVGAVVDRMDAAAAGEDIANRHLTSRHCQLHGQRVVV